MSKKICVVHEGLKTRNGVLLVTGTLFERGVHFRMSTTILGDLSVAEMFRIGSGWTVFPTYVGNVLRTRKCDSSKFT